MELLYLASLAANGYSIHKNGAILYSVFTRLGAAQPVIWHADALFRQKGARYAVQDPFLHAETRFGQFHKQKMRDRIGRFVS